MCCLSSRGRTAGGAGLNRIALSKLCTSAGTTTTTTTDTAATAGRCWWELDLQLSVPHRHRLPEDLQRVQPRRRQTVQLVQLGNVYCTGSFRRIVLKPAELYRNLSGLPVVGVCRYDEAMLATASPRRLRHLRQIPGRTPSCAWQGCDAAA